MKDLNSVYRPVSWSDVQGQKTTVERLREQAISKAGMANAYIFSGRSGVGKTTLARLFFKALNCMTPVKGSPCGECEACKNSKFDMFEINASDTRGIDDMRDIIKDMNYVSTGRFRGILLDEVHMLGKAAWNCLLKPIEESGDKVVWFLCTTELSKIPKTIQTRCQVYKLNPLSWTEIHSRLKQVVDDLKIPISEEELWLIARHADNNLRQALHILEQYSTNNSLENLLAKEASFDFLEALKTNNAKSLWTTFASWESRYPDFDSFLSSLKYDLSICLKIRMGIPVFEETSKIRLDKYREYATMVPQEKIEKALRQILEMQEKLGGVYDYSSLMLLAMLKIM